MVVATKLFAFVLSGTYGPRWQQFGLDDVLRVVRANVLGSVAAVAALLLLDRVFDGLHHDDAHFLLSILLEADHPWTVISSAQAELPHPGWTMHLKINA
mgnify:CR=1 FL=1